MKWIITRVQLIHNPLSKYVSDNAILNSIRDNNEVFSVWVDIQHNGIIAECNNKPRNLLVHGLMWEEL